MGGFVQWCAAVVACAFLFGCFSDFGFRFASGDAYVPFWSSWETFYASCVVACSCRAHSSGRRRVWVFMKHEFAFEVVYFFFEVDVFFCELFDFLAVLAGLEGWGDHSLHTMR